MFVIGRCASPETRPNEPVPPATMASHRAAVWLVAAAVAMVVVASVPAARAVPTAATGVTIGANAIIAGAGAVERAALSFPVANSGDSGARWTAAQVPEAARVSDLAGGGGFSATLHGAVHFTATETASLPGARLLGASEAIAKATASTLREWNIRVVRGLARAIVDDRPLADRFHSACAGLSWGGGRERDRGV